MKSEKENHAMMADDDHNKSSNSNTHLSYETIIFYALCIQMIQILHEYVDHHLDIIMIFVQ